MLDLTSVRFGRLLVLAKAQSKKKKTTWLCKCECGVIKKITTGDLRSGRVNSCGCLHRELLVKYSTVHGKSKTKIYKTWLNMKKRCLDKKSTGFKHYGGRGIKICDRWMSFPDFYSDMGDVPVGMSLDRINTNGNYEPNNCRWANILQQRNNMRSNLRISFKGQEKTLAEWCRYFGINYNLTHHRITKYLWSYEEAFI